jgi:thiol-disulfide isomerase/thioredoxin
LRLQLEKQMSVLSVAFGLLALVGSAEPAPQAANLVADVRAAIVRQDFAAGDRLVADRRAAEGVTPKVLESLSWLGRGALAAGQLDKAESYARETYDLTRGLLKNRAVDDDRSLATALGAAIEVLAQVGARQGARSGAVAFLRQELATWGGTTIRTRIQKNINLLSLEGTPAPAIDITEYVGPRPPGLDTLKGKPVILFFWAHWCGDCKTQVPVLARLLERYADRGLTLVGPTQRYGYVAGGKATTPEDEKQYIDQVRVTAYGALVGMPVPIASSNHERYGVSTTPTIVLVDKDGIVRLYNPGRMTEDALEPHLRRLVGAR